MKRSFRRFLWLPLLASLCGCHPAVLIIPSYIHSVGVQLVDNRTSYYGLETTLTQALIRQFQEDGRLPLVDPDKADLVVKMVLRRFVIEPQMYDPKTNQVMEYRLSFVYDLAAVDEQQKRTFIEDKNRIHSVYYYPPENPSAGTITETRDQATNRLADDLAVVVVRRVLEGN